MGKETASTAHAGCPSQHVHISLWQDLISLKVLLLFGSVAWLLPLKLCVATILPAVGQVELPLSKTASSLLLPSSSLP